MFGKCEFDCTKLLFKFRAVAHFVYKNQDSHKQVRKECADFIEANEDIQGFLAFPMGPNDSIKTVKDYISSLRQVR